MAKIDNMMAILWMLNCDKKVTAKQISEKLEINIRTVYRYIDALSASGVPIIADTGHNGGYTLLDNFVEAPLFFDIQEQTALLHAAVFAKEAGYFLDEALEKATSKLKMYSNENQEKMLQQNLAGLEVIKPVGKQSIESVLRKIEQSISTKVSVEIEYHTGKEEKSKLRKINPYGIVYWNNNWYVVAFCNFRNEIRIFRADRIISINEMQETFNVPESFSAGKFFIDNIINERLDKNKLINLVICGKRNTLNSLCEHWFLGHHIKERTSNEVTFILQEEVVYKYIPHIILPYGKSLEIIEPTNLKNKVVETLKELIKYYEN